MRVSARPYDWPCCADAAASRTALLVAGAHEGWRARCAARDGAGAVVGRVVRALRPAGVMVVRLRHAVPGAPPGPDPFWHLAADADVAASGVDGFFGSALDRVLRDAGRDHLVLTGFGLEGPVHSTLRSANDMGYECLTLVDACAACEPGCAGPAIETITMSGGIFGAVAPAAALVGVLAPGAEL